MSDARALLISMVGTQLRSENELSLSDRQILSVVILFCDHNVPVASMADRLFDEFGTLSAIISAPIARLSAIEGMTDRLCAFLKFLYQFKLQSLKSGMANRPRIGGTDDLRNYLIARLRDSAVEELHVLFLDHDCGLLSADTLWRGTTDGVWGYPVEIVKRAVQLGASRIVLVHNHPSRRAGPSTADIAFTNKVTTIARAMGIVLQDHIIVAGETLVSLMKEIGCAETQHPSLPAVACQEPDEGTATPLPDELG